MRSPQRQGSQPHRSVIHWLLDADPVIRWQALRDLTDAPDEVGAAERAQVAMVSSGAHLLSLQQPDGDWGGGPWVFQK